MNINNRFQSSRLGHKNMYKFKISTVFYSAIFVLIISGTGFAFAQEFEAEQFYTPATEGLIAFATNVAESIPKIVAAVILLIIGFFVGKVVHRAVEKASTKILQKVDSQNDAEVEIKELSTNKLNSSKLIAATIKWFVYIFFIVAAIDALEFLELSQALTQLWLWVPNLLAFVLILIIGSIIVKYVIKWVDQEIVKHGFGNSKYVITGIKVVMYGIIFSVAITQLGIGESIVPILVSAFAWSIAIAVGAAIAVGLGFTLKDILPAAIAGVADHRSFLKVGQKIKIGDVTGTITSVGTLHIIITNEKNEGLVIPTKEFVGNRFTILSSN